LRSRDRGSWIEDLEWEWGAYRIRVGAASHGEDAELVFALIELRLDFITRISGAPLAHERGVGAWTQRPVVSYDPCNVYVL
jgi:hypothetical protein